MSTSDEPVDACDGICKLDSNNTADCSACGENCYCEIPQIPPNGDVDLPCQELTIGSEELRGAVNAAAPGASTISQILVRVPIVDDPAHYRSIVIPVGSPMRVSFHGWQIFTVPSRSGPPAPVVTPATLRTDTVEVTDKVLSASVILIGDELVQYWVPVTDSRGWAALQLSELTVIFTRNPIP